LSDLWSGNLLWSEGGGQEFSELPHRQAWFSLLAQCRAYRKSTRGVAGVRDPDALANLSEDERKSWQALWTDVEAMLKQANAK
jgi:hypothetical protein